MEAPRRGSALEKNSRYLFRHSICLLATHLLRHRGILLKTGADAHYESLIAHPAHHHLGGCAALSLDAAHHSLIADRREGIRLRRTLSDVRGEFLGNIAHDVDRDTQLVNHILVVSRKFADSFAPIADRGT